MGCSCTKQSFRFKNLVVAVYPTDPEGEANLDALGKLRSYVAANPERIPRVCRKVQKLIVLDLEKRRVHRVNIGVLILRDLMDNATELEYFVPHVAELSMMFLTQPEREIRMSAADLLSVLTYHLGERLSLEHPRRLLADCQDELLLPLADACADGVGTSDVIQMHCRYAGIVAVGNVAAALQSRVVDKVNQLVVPVLQNLFVVFKRASSLREVARRDTPPPTFLTLDSTAVANDGIKSVTLSVEADQKDTLFFRACIRAVASLASCCTTAAVSKFLHSVSTTIDKLQGWENRRFVVEVYRCITYALQKRPHPLGFAVCQHLAELADADGAPSKIYTVFLAIARSTDILPLSGGRPSTLFEFIKRALKRPSWVAPVEGANERCGPSIADAAIDAMKVISHRTSVNMNRQQQLRMVQETAHMLKENRNAELVEYILRAMSALLFHLNQMSVEERRRSSVLDALSPFLYAADGVRLHASRCLTVYISRCCAVEAASKDAPTAPQFGLQSRPDELHFIHTWLSNMVRRMDHTAETIACVGDVCAAYVFVLGFSGLRWMLGFVFDTQDTLIAATNDKGKSTSVESAVHMMLLALVNVIGTALAIDPLLELVHETSRKRYKSNPCEMCSDFENNLVKPTALQCGLRPTSTHLLQTSMAPPVTHHLVRSAVAVAVLRGDAVSLMQAFRVAELSMLEEAVTSASAAGEPGKAGTPPSAQTPGTRSDFNVDGGLESPVANADPSSSLRHNAVSSTSLDAAAMTPVHQRRLSMDPATFINNHPEDGGMENSGRSRGECRFTVAQCGDKSRISRRQSARDGTVLSTAASIDEQVDRLMAMYRTSSTVAKQPDSSLARLNTEMAFVTLGGAKDQAAAAAVTMAPLSPIGSDNGDMDVPELTSPKKRYDPLQNTTTSPPSAGRASFASQSHIDVNVSFDNGDPDSNENSSQVVSREMSFRNSVTNRNRSVSMTTAKAMRMKTEEKVDPHASFAYVVQQTQIPRFPVEHLDLI